MKQNIELIKEITKDLDLSLEALGLLNEALIKINNIKNDDLKEFYTETFYSFKK
jgi:hypothetical protein